MIRRLLICSSLATWCFLNSWVELAEGDSFYFARYHPLKTVILPVISWEILITVAALTVWEIWRRYQKQHTAASAALLLFLCFFPLGIASVALLRAVPFNVVPLIRKPLFWPLVLVLAIPLSMLAIRRPGRFARGIGATLLYSSPVLALIVFQAARATIRFPVSAYADAGLARRIENGPQTRRVVWIIFDEMSQEIAFANRPASLSLPNLDRLRQQSFYASAARSPSGATETSIPSLIIGERVSAAEPSAPNRLLLTVQGRSQPVDWREVRNVFDSSRQLGYNTALVGWFHPYGRLLNRSLTKCYWTPGWLLSGVEEAAFPLSLTASLRDRAYLQFAAMPLVGHFPGVHPEQRQRKAKLRRFFYLVDRAVEVVADPAIGLAFIHLPVPHPPAIYSRSSRRYTTVEPADYLDSVALADQTLGILRRTMEAAGQWDRTAVIVSADHGWRTYLWRGDSDWSGEEEAVSHRSTMGVPFLLKFANQTTEVFYDRPFDTLSTSRIVEALLARRLTDPLHLTDQIDP